MSALSPDDYPAYAENISNKKQKPLGWGSRPALIIIDVGNAYFSPDSPLSLLTSTCGTGKSLPGTVESLVAAARGGGCPVIWARTLFTNPKLRDAGLWSQKIPAEVLTVFGEKDSRNLAGFLEPLQPLRDVIEGMKTVPDLLVDKKFASAFFGTNLATQLTVLGVDTLVFCGAKTGGEIRQSVLDAQGLGFRGIIAADACADTCKETHFANLFDIRAKMGDVITSADAAEGLKRGWSWPA
ncbi:putative N-carbamoylsarcosine amidase [Pleurostoma richardsiae]|uniref:N-carbamoylsarcosine amidase n=1 Tax=Pleurostoma richardsiae TaxID=41990 RepID=A0AA38S062_9PEZI|nr:putative N-carbamoylsarcosine amidase [Pleurostoma richardsiae]